MPQSSDADLTALRGDPKVCLWVFISRVKKQDAHNNAYIRTFSKVRIRRESAHLCRDEKPKTLDFQAF